ncbi:uncharacterized protein cubi_02394 [Cryptosporidium ubiquitum]|uniref:Uncharacterized protein n=1 Tax=Cryptosporidium ubiquitum TaxID=857276 RepID=A0A1J4MFX0_9CRYT|nr:uncharacterized protein cubi_02394 [Cryptosporidium ubiquitum]OII73162.1 hypothetical protein cubi_02394 [Cryptosporidium ubiquitum]
MIGNSEEYIRKPSFLFWEDDGQNKAPMTPSTLSPASLHEVNSPLLNSKKMITNSIYSKVKERRNLMPMEGNSEKEKPISENIPCLANNSIGMLGWSENIIHDDDLPNNNDRNGIFNYNYYNSNADDMFQSEDKIGCQEMLDQIISSKFLLENDNKTSERNINRSNTQTQCCPSLPGEKMKLNSQITNYSGNVSSVSIYNVTDTVFKEMRLEGTSEPKDISRYMDNEYLDILKTNLMLEFTKSRTCYLKLVPSVIEIFKIVRDAPNRCPIPIVQSIDDLGKEKNIEEFENYFVNCVSKQNSGFLAFCTEKRALKSGGGGKYYFFDKKLQLNGCHKVDVLNHHRQKNIMGPVFMKVLLFMFVVDPPYHLDPRARSSNPQRLMDFYYQLKSMNKLKSIKRLLKVWCMEMCPEEYLDAGYPLGSLLWVSTLDIESHIKKWRYRGKKSNGQFEYMTPTINNLEEREFRKNMLPEIIGFGNTERNVNEENLQINLNQGLEGLNIPKKDLIGEENCIEKGGKNSTDCIRSSSSSECNESAAEIQALNQGSIFCKSPKKNRGRGRPKSKQKPVFLEEEGHECPRKRMFLSEENENNNSMIANEKCSEVSQDESIEELELELGMEFEQVSTLGYSSNFIWDLVRSIPIESLNKLYISWLDGNIPGVTKLIVNSSVVHEYLNMQKNVENSRFEDSSLQTYSCKEMNSDISNEKKDSGILNSRKTILYHKALYLAIQQHLLMYSSELQALLKALEGNHIITERDTENLDPFHKNLDVVLNSISPLQHLSMSFHCNSPLGIVEEDQIDDGDISREGRIRNSSEEKLIHGCDEHTNSNISRNSLVDDDGGSLLESQNLSETPRLGNNMHDSSSIFSIITSAQYQDFVELPDITSSFSDQLLNDHTELSKHCTNIGEPIDFFFAIS